MRLHGLIATFLAAALLGGCATPPRPYTLPAKDGLLPEVVRFPSMETVEIDGFPFGFEFRFRKLGERKLFDGEATANARTGMPESGKTRIRRIAAGVIETRELGGATGFRTVAFTEHPGNSFAYSGKMTYEGLLFEFSKSCNYYRTPRDGGKSRIRPADAVRAFRATYGRPDATRTSTRHFANGEAEVTELWWGIDESELLCQAHGEGAAAHTNCTTPPEFRRKSLHAIVVDTSKLADCPDRFTTTLTMRDGQARWVNYHRARPEAAAP
jgi:hypothetical protein